MLAFLAQKVESSNEFDNRQAVDVSFFSPLIE
jgi:hypothetical protein